VTGAAGPHRARAARPGRWLRAAAALAVVLVPAVSGAQVADWPVESPPRPLPAREVDFPPYEIKTLANGLQVVVVKHHEQPVVSLRLLVRAGGAQDPPGKQGVGALAAALLDQGAGARDAAQIADAIDTIGGGLNTGAGSDLSVADVLVMKDSLAFGFELLADVVRRPTFRPEELDRQRQQALSGMRVNFQDPDSVASLVFDRLVYGFHPYGLPNTGTPESLAAITPDDLREFHTTWFVPNNALLGIVGDIGVAEALAAAEKAFGDWKPGPLPAADHPAPPPPTRRVVVINKPDAVQTEVRVGNLGLPRTHKDYLAFDLALKILGGEGANRLHQVLRSDRGLTYGASADLTSRRESGDFAAETDTRSDATGEVLRLIVDEISRLQREPVSPRELRSAQDYLAGKFPLTIETAGAIATQVLDVLFYGLPLTDIETYRQRVLAITPADIQRVARQYLHTDRLSVVLVGNAAAFTGQLAGVGFDRFEQVELSQLDLSSATFQRRTAPSEAGVR
jgi:zinc protease